MPSPSTNPCEMCLGLHHSITDMYIAAYPLDTQFEYNSRLLNLGKKKDTTPTKDRIEKMTEQEAKELLLKLLGTK